MSYTMLMPEDIIANLILALQAHPSLALAFVFLVAFSESLVVVGLIVPGAILMILFGALITMDALEFWPTVFFATIGAIAGDSLSYWLGRRYKNKLHNIWPLSTHPEIIIHANEFFNQYGVKSIVFSRFIGLLRPVIPAIAGMSKMPAKLFLISNISSAVLWAPLYLLPGVLFGLSIEMASEFAGKFIFLIVLLLLVIILVLQIIQRMYVFTKPYNNKLITRALSWGKRHPLIGEIPAAIFDGDHPEIRGLSMVALIIFAFTLLLTLLSGRLSLAYNPFYYDFDSLNQFIYLSLQTFRSPPLDSIMLWLTYLSSSHFFALLCFSLGGLFILKKDLISFWYWLAAIALPILLAPLFTNNLTTSLQQNLNININIQSLPIIVIVSTIGFLTIIINSGLSFRRQKIIYYLSSTLVLFLVMAQLYFAAQVFSQVVFGIFIGVIWFNLLGIAYRRHTKKITSKDTRLKTLLIIATLLIYPGWKTFQQDELYSPSENYFVMGTNSWIESGWEILPVLRQGINQDKSDVFNLQWLGTIQSINSKLNRLGFSNNVDSAQRFSNWFLDDANINQLPVLPHIHKGEYETLRFYKYNQNNNELNIIRLWPSKYKLKQESPAQPLWFGSISIAEIKKNLGITYLVTRKENIDDIKFNSELLTIHKKTIFNNKENKERTIFLLQ